MQVLSDGEFLRVRLCRLILNTPSSVNGICIQCFSAYEWTGALQNFSCTQQEQFFFFHSTVLTHGISSTYELQGVMIPMYLWSLYSQEFSQAELSCTLYIHQEHMHNFISEMLCTAACYKQPANIFITGIFYIQDCSSFQPYTLWRAGTLPPLYIWP